VPLDFDRAIRAERLRIRAYSVYQQGAGRINAYAAVYSQAMNCANQGLDIGADLSAPLTTGAGTPQYVERDYFVVNSSGNALNNDGYVWSPYLPRARLSLEQRVHVVDNGYLWNCGFVWNQSTVSTASSSSGNNSRRAAAICEQRVLWNNGYL